VKKCSNPFTPLYFTPLGYFGGIKSERFPDQILGPKIDVDKAENLD